MKKRTLSLVLAVVMCVCLAAPSYAAEDDIVSYIVEGGYIYFDKSTGTIVDCDTNVTAETIPSVIEGVTVTAIGDSAFYSCRRLTNFTIPNTITNIGEEAFRYCSNLASVTIPDSVTEIGAGAFKQCPNLTNIFGMNSITSISYEMFYESGLTNLNIPHGVTKLGVRAFFTVLN